MQTAAATSITFTLNGEQVRLPAGTVPTTTLLDWLRGAARLTGTKEGCAEGDCGACTVVLEQPDGTRTPINSCLAMLGQLHGSAIRTVEGLRDSDGRPNEVADALASCGGTQCGFCTPGIVMSAWAYAREGGELHEALAGNLCRCTGYRPIVEACHSFTDAAAAPLATTPPQPTASARFAAEGYEFLRPTTMEDLLAARTANPGALLLAGGTDLGLLVSEGRKILPSIISLSNVPQLQALTNTPEGLRIGAAVSYERVLNFLLAHPDDKLAPLAALLRRLGSRQIRGMGTFGGNLGTASPIGDALPPLLALGATVRLRDPSETNDMLVEEFLLGYRRNALAADEIIESVFLPRPGAGAFFACEKLSKRHDQDISTVGLSLLVDISCGIVTRACLALGGMGPMAARAPATEAALLGQRWNEAEVDKAATILESEFSPLADLRATAEYRRMTAGNLLRRIWWRQARPDIFAEPHAIPDNAAFSETVR